MAPRGLDLQTENIQLGVDWKLSKNDTLSLQVQQRAVLDKKGHEFFHLTH
jgi:hypothetical protein